MTKKFCDRDGRLITSEGFTMTWFNDQQIITSDLCAKCHAELMVWFGIGNPSLEAVAIGAEELQSSDVLKRLPKVVPPVVK